MTNIETWRYQYRNNYQAARYLLANEAQGFAFDATIHSAGEAVAAYTGGPVGGTVTVKSASDAGDVLISKSLDESNLVQTGTSPKMVLWSSAPYVRWTPHNLLLQSQTLGTTWSVAELSVSSNAAAAPDGTMTAEKLVENGAVDVHQLNQTYTTAAVVVTFSAYLKAAERTHACLTLRTDSAQRYGAVFDLSNGTVTDTEAENGIAGTDNDIISVGDGWYRCSVTILSLGANDTAQISPSDSATPTFVQAAPSYDGDATSGIYAWGAQVNRGYSPTPYLVTTTAARYGIPQEWDTAASKFGILVEPAATNISLYSDINTTGGFWGETNATITANSATSPEGATKAALINEGTLTDFHLVAQNGNIDLTSTNATFSIFLKYIDRQYVVIEFFRNGGAFQAVYCNVDLLNGTISDSGAANGGTLVSTSITSVGNGWYRVTLTGTTGASTGHQWRISPSNVSTGSAVSFAGTSKTFYAWGGQFELGIATSYIPTLGATVTRAADHVNIATSTYPHSATAGTIYVDFKISGDTGTYQFIYSLDDGDDNDRLAVAKNNTDYVISADGMSGGASQGSITLGTASANTRRQTTVAWASNDHDGSMDGGAVASDGTFTLSVGLTTLRLGRAAVTPLPLLGRYYRLVYVPYQRETVSGDLETWRYTA